MNDDSNKSHGSRTRLGLEIGAIIALIGITATVTSFYWKLMHKVDHDLAINAEFQAAIKKLVVEDETFKDAIAEKIDGIEKTERELLHRRDGLLRSWVKEIIDKDCQPLPPTLKAQALQQLDHLAPDWNQQ